MTTGGHASSQICVIWSSKSISLFQTGCQPFNDRRCLLKMSISSFYLNMGQGCGLATCDLQPHKDRWLELGNCHPFGQGSSSLLPPILPS